MPENLFDESVEMTIQFAINSWVNSKSYFKL